MYHNARPGKVLHANSKYDLQEKTEAMVAGTAVHAALEAELVKVLNCSYACILPQTIADT